MRGFQFSIGWLLAAVAFVAVASAILANPGPVSGTAASTLTIALVCYAPVAAVLLRDERKAFWTGAAIPAGIYCYFVTMFSMSVTFDLSGVFRGLLELGTRLEYEANQDTYTFANSAMNLLTWPIALIGGILGRHLYNTRQDAE